MKKDMLKQSHLSQRFSGETADDLKCGGSFIFVGGGG